MSPSCWWSRCYLMILWWCGFGSETQPCTLGLSTRSSRWDTCRLQVRQALTIRGKPIPKRYVNEAMTFWQVLTNIYTSICLTLSDSAWFYAGWYHRELLQDTSSEGPPISWSWKSLKISWLHLGAKLPSFCSSSSPKNLYFETKRKETPQLAHHPHPPSSKSLKTCFHFGLDVFSKFLRSGLTIGRAQKILRMERR